MVCSSWSWPNLFDVARSKIGLYNDAKSIVNRVKLLMLTEPAELYMYPNFGLGLKKHMFTYNNDNAIALIKDELIEQLRMWEPDVIPEETKVERGLKYTGSSDPVTSATSLNKLELTVTLTTRWMQVVSFSFTTDLNNGGTMQYAR